MFLHRVQLHLRRPRHILIKFNLKATTALSNVSLLLTCSGGPEGFRSAATTETHQQTELTDYRWMKTMNPSSKVLKIKCWTKRLQSCVSGRNHWPNVKPELIPNQSLTGPCIPAVPRRNHKVANCKSQNSSLLLKS